MMSIGILPAAQTFRIDDRHCMTAPVNGYVKTFLRRWSFANPTLMHVVMEKNR